MDVYCVLRRQIKSWGATVDIVKAYTSYDYAEDYCRQMRDSNLNSTTEWTAQSVKVE